MMFDSLLENIQSFSLIPDDDEFYLPNISSSPSSVSPPPISSSPTPSDFVIFSQNAHKSNKTTHAILNIASSMSPPADLILIQEPWFGKVGVNPQMAQGNPIIDNYGCPKHKDWQAVLPSSATSSSFPDVVTYVPSSRSRWTFSQRSDIISSPGVLCLEISSSSPSFLVFNVYNNVDNTAVDAISSLSSILPRSIFLGDFNLHHPMWSADEHLDKRSDKSDCMVDLFTQNGFSLLNNSKEETFFVFRNLNGYPHLYTSTLDLGWCSSNLLPFVSDFQVAKQHHSGSNHYPLLLPPHSFSPTIASANGWTPFSSTSPPCRNSLIRSPTSRPSTSPSPRCRAPSSPQATRYASGGFLLPNMPNGSIGESATLFTTCVLRGNGWPHYRLPTMRCDTTSLVNGSTVKPGADLYRLDNWYRGVRKTTVPTLKRVDNDTVTWVSQSKDKASLLANSWFPQADPKPAVCSHSLPPAPMRDFHTVTNEEVISLLMGTSSSTAPGLSGMLYKVWKWVATVALDMLVDVVRAAVTLGTHHPSWKQSVIAVIPKNNKKDMSLPKSHHPIQLVECLGKLVEKLVAKRITYDLGRYELMPFNQFGGRSNSSCLDAGLSLTHDIQTARKMGLVSSFLAVDMKGFFDHVNHERLLDVLTHKGFPPNITQWVSSFLSDRMVRVRVDDYVGDPHPQSVSVPQGSPVSPVLACVYSSVILEDLNHDPIFIDHSATLIPVAPRAYVDDIGFLASSPDLKTNTHLLKMTLGRASHTASSIGLSFDPNKCDLMHFSFRHQDSSCPALSTTLHGKHITITPPSSIRWLWFHLDRRLTFIHHISLLAKKGLATVHGLKVLGNTIEGISPSNLRLLYKTVVVPAITYGSQLWYNPTCPNTRLLKPLEKVQHKALIQIAGAFWDSPEHALQLLTYVPPIRGTIHKLWQSAAPRIPRLPISSEISRRLPVGHIPSSSGFVVCLISPLHVPFPRPTIKDTTPHSLSPLNRMAHFLDHNMERADPFHSDNSPHTLRLSSPPYAGRLYIQTTACPLKGRASYVANQRVWLTTREPRSSLCIFTDGSRTSKAAGWAVTGIHASKLLFSHSIPFAKKAGNHDAEMYTLAHASKLVLETMLGKPHIREFRIFCDSTSALTSIFDPSPHGAQQASLMFQSNMLRLFTSRRDVCGRMVWTPGHGGLDHTEFTDQMARLASRQGDRFALPPFYSRSAALTEVQATALRSWHAHLDRMEDRREKIFCLESGFHPFPHKHGKKSTTFLRNNPPKWFKNISRGLMSRLTQMCTNHAPTGEYFKRSVWKYRDKPSSFFECLCKHTTSYPPTLQTRDHIIRACPIFNDAHDHLRHRWPWIDNPRRSLGSLTSPALIEHTLVFLKAGPFSRLYALS
jgi:hypothetical protein